MNEREKVAQNLKLSQKDKEEFESFLKYWIENIRPKFKTAHKSLITEEEYSVLVRMRLNSQTFKEINRKGRNPITKEPYSRSAESLYKSGLEKLEGFTGSIFPEFFFELNFALLPFITRKEAKEEIFKK